MCLSIYYPSIKKNMTKIKSNKSCLRIMKIIIIDYIFFAYEERWSRFSGSYGVYEI